MLDGKVASSKTVLPEVLSVSAEKGKKKCVWKLKYQHIPDPRGLGGTADVSEPLLAIVMISSTSPVLPILV